MFTINAITEKSLPVPANIPMGELPAAKIDSALQKLQEWVEFRDYSGFEPYDILNSPLLSFPWLRRSHVSIAFVQIGRRWGGSRLRSLLRVPSSKNPKALALLLASYCDR